MSKQTKTKPKPPDPYRCQARWQEGSFMTFGPKPWVRCSKRPTVVAIEKRSVDKQPKGSMSLCDECLVQLIAKASKNYATFEPIGVYKGVMQRDKSK